jgi:hypothetical protein
MIAAVSTDKIAAAAEEKFQRSEGPSSSAAAVQLKFQHRMLIFAPYHHPCRKIE